MTPVLSYRAQERRPSNAQQPDGACILPPPLSLPSSTASTGGQLESHQHAEFNISELQPFTLLNSGKHRLDNLVPLNIQTC